MLALPRYGGSMDDMHRYLLGRLRKATEVYFYERWKLESFGFLRKRIDNIAFDSGFHFRQIGGRPPRIEVDFEAYVCGDPRLRQALAGQSRVVFPEARLLYGMTVYCGFCDGPFTRVAQHLQPPRELLYKGARTGDRRRGRFDVDFVVDTPGPEGRRLFRLLRREQGGGSHIQQQGPQLHVSPRP